MTAERSSRHEPVRMSSARLLAERRYTEVLFCQKKRLRAAHSVTAVNGHANEKKQNHVGRTVGRVIGTIVLIGLITSALLACFAAVYIKNVILPNADLDLSWFNVDLSSTMYYLDSSTGEYKELTTLHGTENRIWVDGDQIPQYLKDAAVAIEDKRFYKHGGVDWIRTLNGVLRMFHRRRYPRRFHHHPAADQKPDGV